MQLRHANVGRRQERSESDDGSSVESDEEPGRVANPEGWSMAEDEALIDLVSEELRQGKETPSWFAVAASLEARTGPQCSKRWHALGMPTNAAESAGSMELEQCSSTPCFAADSHATAMPVEGLGMCHATLLREPKGQIRVRVYYPPTSDVYEMRCSESELERALQ